jgi:orotidine-5'-phosphate decarboxylase
MNQQPIIVALDFSDSTAALNLAIRLRGQPCHLKVGKELFTRSGPKIIEQLQALDFKIFLDLKFHDIPNTVAKAVEAAAAMGVWMVNIHASGGVKMMQAARDALTKFSQPPHLIAVTVLTSLTDAELKDIGLNVTAEKQVQRLALLTRQTGLDGVVCSPKEIKVLREMMGENFLLVTPGIRPIGSAQNDQQRTLTPSQALDLGANYLVIGRPITTAPDPVVALQEIQCSLVS